MVQTRKLTKTSLADQVCDSLKEMILNDFAVGDKLPSENEMAAMFGVSRLTVRLALQKLNVQGLILTKIGEGSFVQKFSFDKYMENVSDIMMTPKMLDDLLEFRSCIEVECVRLAIQNCKDSDFVTLENILESMAELVYDFSAPNNHILEQYVERDYEFHETICRIGGNSLFHLAFMAAQTPLKTYLLNIGMMRINAFHQRNPQVRSIYIDRQLNTTHSHAGILQGLKARDFEKCKSVYSFLLNYKEIDLPYVSNPAADQ